MRVGAACQTVTSVARHDHLCTTARRCSVRLRQPCASSLADTSHCSGCHRRRVRIVAHCCCSNPRHSEPRQHTAHLHNAVNPATRDRYPLIRTIQQPTVMHYKTSQQTLGTHNHPQQLEQGHTTAASHVVQPQLRRCAPLDFAALPDPHPPDHAITTTTYT